jgi:hypothetical protein
VNPAHVQEIYGPAALELVLPADCPEQKLCDMFERPEHYVAVTDRVRQHLTTVHSHRARLQELIGIIEQ